MLKRPAISIVSVTFSCARHGLSEQVRTYDGSRLLTHGGDVFPCRCWYELSDNWFGEWDKQRNAAEEAALELFPEIAGYPQGETG
jgi:hypothetical protein